MYRKSLFLIITFDKPQSMLLVQGLGQETETQKKVLDFLKATVPLVIDADALNILSINKEWLALLQPKTILTPHPKNWNV
jgi:NAD(P)H-hydrate repair Nnr-like enzyme with NAD(P)H-hydrate dehydratase domain